MPMYEWRCDSCEVYWEDLYNKPEDAPQKRKCPSCKKLRPRAMSTFGLRFIGSGFYCNDYGSNHWTHSGSKDAAETFVKEAEAASEKRMETGYHNYKVYTPDFDVLEKKGDVKKIQGNASDIVNEKAQRYRAIAKHAYKESGIDPKTQKKTNVDLMTTPDKKGLE